MSSLEYRSELKWLMHRKSQLISWIVTDGYPGGSLRVGQRRALARLLFSDLQNFMHEHGRTEEFAMNFGLVLKLFSLINKASDALSDGNISDEELQDMLIVIAEIINELELD